MSHPLPSLPPFPPAEPPRPRETSVWKIHTGRDWEPIGKGVYARYTAIWGAGEFARAEIELLFTEES